MLTCGAVGRRPPGAHRRDRQRSPRQAIERWPDPDRPLRRRRRRHRGNGRLPDGRPGRRLSTWPSARSRPPTRRRPRRPLLRRAMGYAATRSRRTGRGPRDATARSRITPAERGLAALAMEADVNRALLLADARPRRARSRWPATSGPRRPPPARRSTRCGRCRSLGHLLLRQDTAAGLADGVRRARRGASDRLPGGDRRQPPVAGVGTRSSTGQYRARRRGAARAVRRNLLARGRRRRHPRRAATRPPSCCTPSARRHGARSPPRRCRCRSSGRWGARWTPSSSFRHTTRRR